MDRQSPARLQTGYFRSYVLFLVLAAIGLWILLNAYYLAGMAPTVTVSYSNAAG